MEIYTLDSLFRRVQVIDVFKSFIWTDRMKDVGDFELILNKNSSFIPYLPAGTMLSCNESLHVMVLETIEDTNADDGTVARKYTGRSFEKIMADRAARDVLNNTTYEPKWVVSDIPSEVALYVFSQVCEIGVLDVGDIIPHINASGSDPLVPADTIAVPPDPIDYQIDIVSVLDVERDLATQYNMGFRILLDPSGPDTPLLYFDIYMGVDRTSQQTTYDAVIMSPDLDNLQNINELTSIALYKNVAYVISPVGAEIVYALDVDPAIAGLDRRVMFVNATDITDPSPTVATAQMLARGANALASQTAVSAFDGEINEFSKYKPGRDYNLGDLIELRDSQGQTNTMQVTEQIFVSDASGDRSYPTLTLYQFITPGTYASWDPEEDYSDVDALLDYSSLPD